MTNNEIKNILFNIINELLDKRIDTYDANNKLISKLDANEIYHINDFFITDCYFAIKHLLEKGFETSDAELQYFRECFLGKRIYDINEKNDYILKNAYT